MPNKSVLNKSVLNSSVNNSVSSLFSTHMSPKYKACLFDMDGLLLDTESKYTVVTNEILADFNTGRELTWDIKVQLQGRTGDVSAAILIKEYNLPVTPDELRALSLQKQEKQWPTSQFLPGALELLQYLKAHNVPIALCTSSNQLNYARKTDHLQAGGFDLFAGHIVTGDDARIPPGRGKPFPDIWAVGLGSINAGRSPENQISPHECLVFEDGLPGVEAGRAFGARVVWVPDENALRVLEGQEDEIVGANGVILKTLEDFDVKKYGL